eukprot:jgi/Chrzof1/705/Cz01g25150.t1
MFKKFGKDEISGINQVKASVARGVRSSIAQQYPYLDETGVLNLLIPKKEPMYIAKWCVHQHSASSHCFPMQQSGPVYVLRFKVA